MNDPGLDLHAQQTPLLRPASQGLENLLQVTVSASAPVSGELRFEAGTWQQAVTVDSAQTTAQIDLFVPEPMAPSPARILFQDQRGAQVAVEIHLQPVRHWEIFLVHHSHLDMGFTHTQPEVLRRHLEYLRDVLDAIEQTTNYPEPTRMRWTVEAAWVLERFLQASGPRTRERVLRYIADGRIEVGALAMNMHTEVCSLGELVDLMRPAQRLARASRVPVVSALHSDVPGLTWVMADLLAAAGVRYLSVAPNNHRAPFHQLRGQALPRPFRWEGPGGGQVLVWYTSHPVLAYMEGNDLGLADRVDLAEDRLARHLSDIEAQGFPGRVLHLRIQGRFIDNGPPASRIADIATQWNRRWAYPRLRMAVNREFFERIVAEEDPGAFPVFKADWPDWWADGIASQARELALARDARERAEAAASALALMGAYGQVDYPAAMVAEASRQALLFDEHTWGAHLTRGVALEGAASGDIQRSIKRAYAFSAATAAHELTALAADAWPKRISPGPRLSIAIHNPLAFPRSDIAQVRLYRHSLPPSGFRLVDERDAPVPCEVAEADDDIITLDVLVDRITGFGTRVYRVMPARGLPVAESRFPPELPLQTDRFVLMPEAQGGGLSRLFDRILGVDLVAPGHSLGRFQYRRVLTVPPERELRQAVTHRFGARGVRVVATSVGPLYAGLSLAMSGEGADALEVDVRVVPRLDRVHWDYRILKRPLCEGKEMGLLEFPFHVPDGVLRVESAGAVMVARQDQLPGSATDWYVIRHYADLGGDRYGITFASRHAPLIHLAPAYPPDGFPAASTPGFSVDLFNNLWPVNFAPDQEGELRFSFAVFVREGPFDPVAADRLAHGFAAGFLTSVHASACVDADPALAELSPAGIRLVSIEPGSERGELVVRLLEIAGKQTSARLKFATAVTAARCGGLWGQAPRPLAITADGAIELDVGPHALSTVFVQLRDPQST